MSLSKNNKAIIAIVCFTIVIAGFVSYKIAYKAHPSIVSQKVDFTGTATTFLVQIKEHPQKWQHPIVSLKGTITAIDTQGIMLDEIVYCQFKDSTQLASLQQQQTVIIKGRMIGYDDLLEEVKLDQCILNKH